MSKIKEILKREFISGTTAFDWVFLGIGLLLQVIAISISVYLQDDPNLVITAISGITGVISVVLCARGKLSQYIFGYIQLFTYLFGVAIPYGLGGETFENIIYAITMVIGIVVWIKRYKNTDVELVVKTKNLSAIAWIITGVTTLVLIICAGLLLSNHTEVNIWLTGSENPTPWLDSITTIVPLVGQLLMCFGYSDQWIFWFIEDVMSLIMFIVLGNWIMVSQYIFWTANTIYGYIKWRKLSVGA